MFRRSMKYAVAVASLASLVVAAPVNATSEKFLLRAGVAQVNSNANSTDLGGLDVGDATGLGINLTYMFAPMFGVEVLGSSPLKHDIELSGAGKIGETEELPPTVLLVVRDSNSAAKIHPYVGLGVNYTMFFNEETTLAGVSLELDDSVGPAFEAGVDYDLNDKWFLNASLWYMDIKTTASLNGVEVADVQINPVAALLTVGTRF